MVIADNYPIPEPFEKPRTWQMCRGNMKQALYGCVSFGLITTGLVFTVFAIFQKDSEIGKVWLAGPTTMVVGLVLCGKVIIDWGPAMLHAREGSIDSRLMEHYVQAGFQLPGIVDPLNNERCSKHLSTKHEPRRNGSLLMGSTTEQSSCMAEAVPLLDHDVLHPNSQYLMLSQHYSSTNDCNLFLFDKFGGQCSGVIPMGRPNMAIVGETLFYRFAGSLGVIEGTVDMSMLGVSCISQVKEEIRVTGLRQ
ncbi:hypothetical protein KIN20_011917 [Parelaphostrongylus tenuis]|uniref:Uncharacterized protein n=1 Tax=Parelaphostrongylus tenuis TaxID=148309 RepID=A0AAD5QMT2_PARTN|nr:hypothetical protein KIN20_011917 [Parelaphostrongylus tenuis]